MRIARLIFLKERLFLTFWGLGRSGLLALAVISMTFLFGNCSSSKGENWFVPPVQNNENGSNGHGTNKELTQLPSEVLAALEEDKQGEVVLSTSGSDDQKILIGKRYLSGAGRYCHRISWPSPQPGATPNVSQVACRLGEKDWLLIRPIENSNLHLSN